MKIIDSNSPIALVGKLGHGKTHLLNRLCGTNYPSAMTARSCTTTVQVGFMRGTGIPVIDTPGFGSSRDIAAHLAAQKVALERTEISGVYAVAKYARADEIAQVANAIMDFTGQDDLRLIITHSDTAAPQVGYNPEELKRELSMLLDIPTSHIIVVGKSTSRSAIEQFIAKTRHEPRFFEVGDEQLAMISKLSVGPRKINKAIDEVYAKIEAASRECETLIRGGKTDATDLCIVTNQKATIDMVKLSKESIFRDAETMPEDQQNIVYGKAGVALSLRLQEFITATNKCLAWDVSDPANQQNLYKACNHCGAVYNKTEGCNEATVCGAIPRDVVKDYSGVPRFDSSFLGSGKSWRILYNYGIRQVGGEEILSHIKVRRIMREGGDSRRILGSKFESGCGNTISWNNMVPVDTAVLGEVKISQIERCSESELFAKLNFDDKIELYEEKNRLVLATALGI